MDRRFHGSTDHGNVVASLRRLAQVYRDQGRLDECVQLEAESLALKRRMCDSKAHSSVAV